MLFSVSLIFHSYNIADANQVNSSETEYAKCNINSLPNWKIYKMIGRDVVV